MGNTLNEIWTISGPHFKQPIHTPVERMIDLLDLQSFWNDELSRKSLQVIHMYVVVSIAFIIAPLLIIARKRTHFPFEPCRHGVARKVLLVCIMISFPSLSTKYTSVTSLLGVVTSPFPCAIWLGPFRALWVVFIDMGRGKMVIFTVCVGLLYVGVLRMAGLGGGRKCSHCE